MNTFTAQITSGSSASLKTISLSPEDGVVSISVQASSVGVVNVLGAYKFQGLTPSNLVLSNGQGVTLSSHFTNSPLSGIIVEWVSGTVQLVISVS
jgi:hypothetical protein